MATAETADSRRHLIATTIAAELDRQARVGAAPLDIAALAEAIERALAPRPTNGEGRHPDELNATNDD